MLATVKKVVRATPVLGRLLGSKQEKPFRTSKEYWEERYQTGGNSGAGSYNRLAEFKAEFINGFVAQQGVDSVLEFGCGDGAQLKLARYPRYMGVDVAPSAVERCTSVFQEDKSKSFFLSGTLPADVRADMTMSLDVIYHLIEDQVFDAYMRELFQRARRCVIVYSSNEDATWGAKHVRHRKFTEWVERNEPSWQLMSKTPNRYPYDPANSRETSFADFYVFSRKDPR